MMPRITTSSAGTTHFGWEPYRTLRMGWQACHVLR